MDFGTLSPALVLVTVVSLSLAPFVAVMVTSFTKIVVVLSLLRNALGLQQVPPNVVLNGLAIILSIYVMYPVILDTHAAVTARMEGRPPPPLSSTLRGPLPAQHSPAAATPAAPAPDPNAQAATPAAPGVAPQATTGPVLASDDPLNASQADAAVQAARPPTVENPNAAPASSGPLIPPGGKMNATHLLALIEAGKEPLRAFLIRHSSDTERAFFLRSAQRLLPADKRAQVTVNDYIVVVPAFTVSELTAAFQIGFLIFLPFLIIDLVVSNILLSLGMMMLSPTTVSLPFKLLLFVLIGGWAKLVHGLVLTYGG